LSLTNTIVRRTNYNITLTEAINIQFRTGTPQISASNRGWKNATRAEVTKYINPDNFLPADLTDLTGMLNTIKIITNNLNIRSGPGTNYSIIGSASKGETYTVVDEKNGWYKIGYGSYNAWVSSHSSYVDRD